jgi:hypothetical protein
LIGTDDEGRYEFRDLAPTSYTLLASYAWLAAQAPKPAATQARTATIRGRVVAADTTLPIRGAQISLFPTSGTPRELREAATDAQGGYEIAELPAGSYALQASKPGYVTMRNGQRSVLTETLTPITVAEGQLIDRVDFQLPRGGVAVVTVVDSRGEPVPDLKVDALTTRFTAGRRILESAVPTGVTDDRGVVRLFGLAPGEYYVSVARQAADGVRPATLYYPGTLAAKDAQSVTIRAAQESHVIMPFVTAKGVTLSGTVRRWDGSLITSSSTTVTAVGAGTFSVALHAQTPGGGSTAIPIRVERDGTFRVPDVLPGDYTVQVRSGFVPDGSASDPEYGSVRVTVGSDDVDGISVIAQRGAILRGQISFDSGEPPQDQTPEALRVITFPTGTEPALSIGTTTMRTDWSFEIRGVAATGLLRLASAARGWSAKSVIVDGKDVTETPMTFEPGREYKGIQLTLTQKRAVVAGSATDSLNRQSSSYTVVLFPEDRDLWFARSQIILAAQPDPGGQFKIERLPPGRFLIAAVSSLEPGREQDFDLLARLSQRATNLTLSEGETRTIILRIVESR